MARILAVDDEPTITKLVEAALAKNDHTVICAGSGNEAIFQAKTEKPDLILLDVMMPGMDGHEVHRRLKEDPETADIPIAFLSAVGDISEQLESLEGGAVDYITKPFSPADLRARVHELLDPSMAPVHDKHVDKQKARLRTYKEVMRRKTEGG